MTDIHAAAATQIIAIEPDARRLHRKELVASGPLRVLILGGTSEAAELAARLGGRPDLTITYSLAGRTDQPKVPAGEVRIGGFGGVDGLIAYLASEKISSVIDATHPFAAKMSLNAETACHHLGLRLISLSRNPWAKSQGDRWHEVPDIKSAAARIPQSCGRIFLAIGRQHVDAFTFCTAASFLIRSIDRPSSPLPPNTQLVLERGPFDLENELKLLREHAIDIIVSKNSGGTATYAKIEAARILDIPVVMVSRPEKHTRPTFATVDLVLAELDRLIEEVPL
jgi:precorrin-6A/cobalt-precorrin-6A reductase